MSGPSESSGLARLGTAQSYPCLADTVSPRSSSPGPPGSRTNPLPTPTCPFSSGSDDDSVHLRPVQQQSPSPIRRSPSPVESSRRRSPSPASMMAPLLPSPDSLPATTPSSSGGLSMSCSAASVSSRETSVEKEQRSSAAGDKLSPASYGGPATMETSIVADGISLEGCESAGSGSARSSLELHATRSTAGDSSNGNKVQQIIPNCGAVEKLLKFSPFFPGSRTSSSGAAEASASRPGIKC